MRTPNVVVPLGASLLGTALAATEGKFNVLTMNVAGLPEILNGNEVPGDKKVNSGIIGSKFAVYGYDIIHVQEVRIEDLTSPNCPSTQGVSQLI